VASRGLAERRVERAADMQQAHAGLVTSAAARMKVSGSFSARRWPIMQMSSRGGAAGASAAWAPTGR
jgi:hypothetical protein